MASDAQGGSPAVVIGKVAGQDTSEMPLMEDDDLVQTLPADAPDQPFDIRMLPGRLWGSQHLLDPHVLDVPLQGCAIPT